MDWYQPTKTVLNKFYDNIQKGGIIIIDDYGHHSGAKKVTDKF
jgi:UDP-N-acetylmuramate-alanine ligase